ncbi:glycosyltransferase family 4 protein [Ruminococcus sp.]|uniref:glycosyltransferase family 4 protein n=1 Tax=Ruminococcus sp. TaxID=41978 RepID=UPI0025FDF761|nr:glycosyltransferase family 4 protein [Ruminococcus sp.]
MKRIAIVNQRYGLEVNGGSEYYARLIAERLANRYEVEVLTTKAVDYTTWKDWYARDVETIHGVTVRRFPVERLRARDFNSYNEAYLQELSQGQRSLAKERTWFEKQGPYSPACIRYIRKHKDDYDVFIFVTYLYYLTVMGLPEVADKAIFIPTAHEEPYLHFLTYENLFTRPKAFVFLTDEERKLVRRQFPKTEPIPCDVMGTGVDIPCDPDPAQFRRQYGITDPYLIYVGRIDEGKDCPMLFRYFMEYKKRCGGDLKLVLMGKAVCRIPKHPDIISLGFVPEEDKFHGIAGAKALVLPSKFESLSISVLEAMSLSVPVLVNGACAVLKGHCTKSNGGLFYANYFEFEGAVQYLLHHPVEYMQMCANARAYITRNYDWDVIMQKFSAVIESVGK